MNISIIGIIASIIMFMLLIIIHEAGHFIASKICGVRVEEFSIGMGPLIFNKKKGETQYSLRAVPIGGYCKLESEDEDSDSPRAFTNAKWWKKVIILGAGAFNNILLCLIALFLLFMYCGFLSPVIAKVAPGSTADLAGLKAKDEIVAVDGKYYEEWYDVLYAINDSDGDIEITYVRDGDELTTSVQPIYNEEVDRKLIGITASVNHSPVLAATECVNTCGEYLSTLFDWFIGIFKGQAKADDVVGVVGMVSMASEQAQEGWENLVFFMSIISLNLGVVNMLPFPALDGGRIVFVILRLITKNKIGQKAEFYVNSAGMILLIAFMILLIFRDTFKLIL